MNVSRPRRNVGSASSRVLAFLAAVLLYALLAEGVIEAWVSASPLRWLVSLTLLVYFGATVFMWKYADYWAKAALSTLVLLGLTGLSAWRLGSVEALGGVTIVHLSTATLAAMSVIVALAVSAVLVASVPYLPRSWRIAVFGVSLYCLSPFALGLATGQAFTNVASGTTEWPWLPYWTRGAFLGIRMLLPLGFLAAIYHLFRELGARSAAQIERWGFMAVAISLCFLLAIPDSMQRATALQGRAPALVDRLDLPTGADLRRAGAFTPSPAQSSALVPEKMVAEMDAIQREIPPVRYALEARSQAMGPGAEAAFEFVRDHIRFEAYPGILRGAAGTYAARAGNAADRSLLLAQFLKLKSVPTRFVIGRLPRALAERLFDRIFEPAPPLEPDALGPAGASLMPEADVFLTRLRARAARDYAMIRTALANNLPAGGSPSREQVVGEIERHVWVQAQVDGRWLDFDTTFPDAVAGRTYASPEQTVDTLADDAYQRVTMRVTVETLGGNDLQSETALEFTAHAADLLDREVFLLHVKESGFTGAIAGGIQGEEAWTPVLWIDGTMHKGHAIDFNDQQEAANRGTPPSGGLSSLFGPGGALASGRQFVAEWIEFEITFPDGRRDITRRVLVDRGGVAWRRAATHDPHGLRALPRDAKGITDPRTVHNIWFSAGRHNLAAYAQQVKLLAQALRPVTAPSPAPGPPANVSLSAQLGPIAVQAFPMLVLSDHLIVPALNDSPQYRFYADSPRIFIMSFGQDPQSGPEGFFVLHDLRRDHVRGLARGGAGDAGLVEHKIWFGALEGALEHEMALQYAAAVEAPMSAVTSTSALANREGAVALRAGPAAGEISSMANPETAARIAQAIERGAVVIVPRPTLKGGLPGWWEIAPGEADTRSVMGDFNMAGFNTTRFGGSYGGRTPKTYEVGPGYRGMNENEPGGTEQQAMSGVSKALVAAALVGAVTIIGFLVYRFYTMCIVPLRTGKIADQGPR